MAPVCGHLRCPLESLGSNPLHSFQLNEPLRQELEAVSEKTRILIHAHLAENPQTDISLGSCHFGYLLG